jgi:hypothetical protein
LTGSCWGMFSFPGQHTSYFNSMSPPAPQSAFSRIKHRLLGQTMGRLEWSASETPFRSLNNCPDQKRDTRFRHARCRVQTCVCVEEQWLCGHLSNSFQLVLKIFATYMNCVLPIRTASRNVHIAMTLLPGADPWSRYATNVQTVCDWQLGFL